LGDTTDSIKHLSPLLVVPWSEDKSEADLTLSAHKFNFDESNKFFEQFWESLENKLIKRETSAALFESTSFNCLIAVFKQEKCGLSVERVEKSLVSHINPVNHLSEVL
jgi:hypothetical protein